MKMYIKGLAVDDQEKAARFYTEKLGFVIKHDIPFGEHRWLTLVSAEEPDGVELALEPNVHPASKQFQEALMADGIPFTAFSVENIETETDRLKAAGVAFTQDPTRHGDASTAILNDTCGNLIQLVELHN